MMKLKKNVSDDCLCSATAIVSDKFGQIVCDIFRYVQTSSDISDICLKFDLVFESTICVKQYYDINDIMLNNRIGPERKHPNLKVVLLYHITEGPHLEMICVC